IEADAGWFLQHGRLSAARAKAVTRTVGDLCRRLRPLAGELVDAFAVPPEMLRAEILDLPGQ
ncbi:MAG: acyl-CoA dehydrogenase, partial [Nocardioidaceae bacterium]